MKLNRAFISLVFVTLGVLGFAVSATYLVYQQLLPLTTYATVLTVLFSWPVAFLIVALIFFSMFRDGVDFFLRNISSANMKFPGGVEIQAQLKAPGVSDSSAEESKVAPAPEQQQQVNELIGEIETKEELSAQARQQIEQSYQQAVNAAWFWKYQYLSLYFVSNTKQVLFWFSQRATPAITRQEFHSAWTSFIPSQEQRDLILDVLIQQEMLAVNGVSLQITGAGYSFLQFIGLIPYAPFQGQAA
jgi:hypothetical protein